MKYLILVLSILTFTVGCSARFVKRDVLTQLNKKYSAIYIIKKDTDIGNNQKLKAGTKVKIYILSDSSSIKVYAYSYLDARELTLGKNILYLLDTDFNKEMFNQKLFEKKLSDVIQPVK